MTASGLMRHELAWGAFLLLTWARLVAVQGLGGKWSLAVLSLLAACAAISRLKDPRPRLVFYAVAVQAIFFLIRRVVNVLHPERMDALMERADLLLFGFNPNLALERVSAAWLSDVLSAAYFFAFLPYLAWAFVGYYRGDREIFRRFGSGLFTVYALGFLGYTVAPTVGPYLWMAERFQEPLSGHWLMSAHYALVLGGTNGIDAFPSLHCALTAFVLFFDREKAPGRFRLMMIPVALLWVATVYLRFHYVVDVLAGFMIAALGLWTARRLKGGGAA